MHTIWFPTPVAVFFRRLVNVVSSLSISHQYLGYRFQRETDIGGDGVRYPVKLRDAFRSLHWPTWIHPEHNRTPIAITPDKVTQSTLLARSHSNFSGFSATPHENDPQINECSSDIIHSLLRNPVLYSPVRKPRYPIALCHGLYGFDVRGPSSFPILQMHYWSNVLSILRDKLGAEVLVTSVPSTGSITSRAESLDRFFRKKARGRGINLIAHSMGGLDCRHLITHLKSTDYTPLSLTTIATPHRGSPFMDWCKENIGIGRLRQQEQAKSAALLEGKTTFTQPSTSSRDNKTETLSREAKLTLSLASLPSSFTTLLLSVVDSPAYANLTSAYLDTVFNPNTPDDPAVKYFSVAGRIKNVSVWHPLWLPKMVLDGFEEKEREHLRSNSDPRWMRTEEWGNDALVTVQSARWGEFLGIMEGCDHWDVRGARGIDVDLPSVSVPGLHLGTGGSKSRTSGHTENESKDRDGWNLADWTKFVRAWRNEEKKAAKEAGAGISEQRHRENRPGAEGDAGEKAHADEVVKSSTDKLSAIFDWIVDSVPPSPLSSSSDKASSAEGESKTERERSGKEAERSELATKMDLERFYIALCRKLYDEGL
ncbi:hypothetical protein AcV5_008191 [Taiwanofungus camphoratus]|nr:hypothetical protein AcV5_008191 [Antrodia cinnamomea]